MRVTAIQIAAIARPVHAATQLRFSAGDATGRSARSEVGDRNGPLIVVGVPKSAGCVTPKPAAASSGARATPATIQARGTWVKRLVQSHLIVRPLRPGREPPPRI